MRRDNVIRVTSHLSETRSSHVLHKQECLKQQSSLVNSFLLYFFLIKEMLIAGIVILGKDYRQ